MAKYKVMLKCRGNKDYKEILSTDDKTHAEDVKEYYKNKIYTDDVKIENNTSG